MMRDQWQQHLQQKSNRHLLRVEVWGAFAAAESQAVVTTLSATGQLLLTALLPCL